LKGCKIKKDKMTIDTISIILAVLISFINGLLLSFIAYRPLQTLQLNGYKTDKYFHYLVNTHGRFFSRLIMLCFMSVCALLVINTLFAAFEINAITYVSLSLHFIYLVLFIRNDHKDKKKTPLKFTARVKRLICVLFILIALFTFGAVLLTYYLDSLGLPWLRFFLICLTPMITPYAAIAALYILWPFEKLNNKNYIRRAKSKLKESSRLKIIGITGSYGKTSVKNILHALLEKKYKVLSTPASFNTPMGLTKTILKQLNGEHEIFIAEMGARHVGDIKEICDFVKPDIAVVTSVSNQHLETFGSLENIKNTKYEIVKGLKDGGIAFFNGECEGATELYYRFDGEKYFAATENKASFLGCSDMNITESGLEFSLSADGETVKCRTGLLGKHNIENILIAACVAYKLGVPLQDINAAVSGLRPVPHRLELTKSNGINIIDDSFNASVNGTIAALEVLEKTGSGKKIIITPGLIELGEVQNKENYEFGKRMSPVCDYCILVGRNQTSFIKEGLLADDFPEDKIFTVNSLSAASVKLAEIVKQGDTVLFENDLPDNYSE